MTLAICLVAITPLQCSCLHSTHTRARARAHTQCLCHCSSPRAALVTAQLYCITLTWQQKKTLCIRPAVYRRGTDPRINYARDRRRARTHTHTQCSVCSCESWHFSSACQSNDSETDRTARHSWHTNVALHVGSLFKQGWAATLTSPALVCVCMCVCMRLMGKDCYFWCYHSFGPVLAVWWTVGLALEWLCFAGRRRRDPPIPVNANAVDKHKQTHTHTLLPLFMRLFESWYPSLSLFVFLLYVWMFVPSVRRSAWDRARCKVLRIAHIVLCAAQR